MFAEMVYEFDYREIVNANRINSVDSALCVKNLSNLIRWPYHSKIDTINWNSFIIIIINRIDMQL